MSLFNLNIEKERNDIMSVIVDLYDSFVKFPSNEELKKSKKMAHLVYVTPNMSTICEYAGRTCYKSFNAIKEESYKKFISTVVGLGHESVIEHTNLIYIIFKPQNNKLGKETTDINRELITVLSYNGLLKLSENQAFYILSGNLRMFKDLVREYITIRMKYNTNKYNKIIEDIINSFYQLPKYFFEDMLKNGLLPQPDVWTINPKLKEASSAISFVKLNDYISIINHDDFTFKVKGFATKDDDKLSVKRISMPQAIQHKHNRLTVQIRAPRYITHQLVRHRLASYSQSSQRYILEEGNDVYIPEAIKGNSIADQTARNFFNMSFKTYQGLIEMGIKKEDARAVLSNACMSSVIMTATIEEFNHMIELRSDKAAQNFFRDMIATPLKEYLEKFYELKAENAPKKAVTNKEKAVTKNKPQKTVKNRQHKKSDVNKQGKEKFIKKLSNKNNFKNKSKSTSNKQQKKVVKTVAKNVKKTTPKKSHNDIKTYKKPFSK